MAVFSAKVIGIIAASVIGVGVIATGVGVGLTRNNSAVIENEIEEVSKPNDTNQTQNDSSNVNDQNENNKALNATEVLANLDQNKITFNSSTNRSETYAFNVDASKIKLPQQEELQAKGLNFKISLDKKNSVQKLNEGEIKIQVIAYKNEAKGLVEKLENDVEEEESPSANTQIDPINISIKVFEFKDFKKADTSLVALLDNTKSILDLLKVKDSTRRSEEYKTLDQLNEKSTEPKMKNGLTALLKAQMDSTNAEKTKDVFIEGKAVLEKIEIGKEGEIKDKAIFFLKAVDKTHPLKLVKQMGDDGVKTEALVDSIRTTNLLPNEVELIPVGFDQTKTETTLKKIKEQTTSNHYKVFKKDDVNETIFINLTGENSSEPTRKDVVVNPYVFSATNTDVSELKFDLKVTYGKGSYQTTLDLKDGYGFQMLKAADFSFNVYVKKVDSMENPFDGNALKTELQKYPNVFAETKYLMPQNTSSLASEQMPSKSELKITAQNQQATVMLSSSNNKVDKNSAANLIAFIGYSFKGVMQNNSFFVPFVTTIHYEKYQESA